MMTAFCYNVDLETCSAPETLKNLRGRRGGGGSPHGINIRLEKIPYRSLSSVSSRTLVVRYVDKNASKKHSLIRTCGREKLHHFKRNPYREPKNHEAVIFWSPQQQRPRADTISVCATSQRALQEREMQYVPQRRL